MVAVRARGRQAVIKAPINNEVLRKLRAVPGKVKWEGHVFLFEPTAPALDYVREAFPDAEWDEAAQQFCTVADNLRALSKPREASGRDYVYKTKPYEHQEKVFKDSRDKEAFALLMEQGTGKTKVILDTAAHLFAQGQITGMLVVAKNGVHRNWIETELPIHLPDWVPNRAGFWTSQKGEKGVKNVFTSTGKPELAILTINVEALSTKRGEKVCEQFLLTYPSLVVVDESTCIKTPGAKRTKAVLRLGNLSRFRRILTGTPITRGPLDAYSQFAFLNEDILGFGSFYAFRARYAVLRPLPGKSFHGRPVQIVVDYQNLDELQQKIKDYSYRVLKRDCLDLPPKVYQRHLFEIGEEQRKHYNDLVDDIQTEFQGRRITAPLAMTRLMRLHQVACGFLPPENPDDMGVPIGKTNPRLEALMELLDGIEGKVIIYATYRYNLREIWTVLRERYGSDSVVAYAGGVSSEDRAKAVSDFQKSDSRVRFFLGQTEAAGYGLTLTAASTVIYYSNDYKLETRLQSEDRAHRIGQENSVLYIDLQAVDTVDGKIIDSLITKRDVASRITGDKLLEWLSPETSPRQETLS